jgi:hypothetical protein
MKRLRSQKNNKQTSPFFGGKKMTDFNLQIKVRNGRMLRLIRDKFETTAGLSRACGVSQTKLSEYLCLRSSPYTTMGEIKSSAMKICDALNVMPGDLWTAPILAIKSKKTTHEIELTADEVMQIAAPSGDVVIQRDLLENWAAKLNPRELVAIEFVKIGATAMELASEFGVSVMRANQIQNNALRKMRHRAGVSGNRSFEDVAEYVD